MVQALRVEFNYDVSESRMTRIMFGLYVPLGDETAC
jgi:hypothetical protein